MIAGTSIRTAWQQLPLWSAMSRRDAGPPCGTARFGDHRRRSGGAVVNGASTAAALILYNGRITTLDRSNPTATAAAIQDGSSFVSVGKRNVDVAGRFQRRESST